MVRYFAILFEREKLMDITFRKIDSLAENVFRHADIRRRFGSYVHNDIVDGSQRTLTSPPHFLMWSRLIVKPADVFPVVHQSG